MKMRWLGQGKFFIYVCVGFKNIPQPLCVDVCLMVPGMHVVRYFTKLFCVQ